MKHRLAPLLEGMEMGKSEHDWLEQRLESMTAKEELWKCQEMCSRETPKI